MKISYSNIHTAQLTDTMIYEMFCLFSRYFIYNNELFCRDIREKETITLLMNNENKALIGFSTYDCIEYSDFSVLFSGSTVVDEQYRNESALMEGFLSICAEKIQQFRGKPVYWHLISMGFRTYRFLPLFFNEYFPSCENYSSRLKIILDIVSVERFGSHYNSSTGIVSIPDSERLKPEYAVIPENRKRNRHIAFFLEQNPLYWKGDELSCIAEISVNNMKSIPQKILKDMLND